MPSFLKDLLPVTECGPEALCFQHGKEVPASGSVSQSRTATTTRAPVRTGGAGLRVDMSCHITVLENEKSGSQGICGDAGLGAGHTTSGDG